MAHSWPRRGSFLCRGKGPFAVTLGAGRGHLYLRELSGRQA